MQRKGDISKPFWTPFSWSGEGDWDFPVTDPSGLSIYEEGEFFYIEASLPGLAANDVEVYRHRGMIMIEGKKEEREKQRKYYRKAAASFYYRIPIHASMDLTSEPETNYSNGLVQLKFKKRN